MNREKTVLVCEDSMEGIFTAVYDGWLEGAGERMVEVCISQPEDLELFCNYRKISTDYEKAGKVMRTIRSRLGAEVYENICFAAASRESGRGTAIYHVLRRALAGGRCDRRVMEALADPYVNQVSKLRTRVWHELHRFYGFVRFREVGGGVLFSEISPENDILVMMAPHFSNRFPNENFMIYDVRREKVLIHERGAECVIRSGVKLNESLRECLGSVEEYENLWRVFCKKIAIQERKNEALQSQLLPGKFRGRMTEFQA